MDDVCWRAGVEIEHCHCGTFDFIFARKRCVQFEVRQVGGPDKRRKIVGKAVVHEPLIAFAPYLGRLHPLRPVRRTVLFVEKFAFDAIGIALHRERPILQVRQKHRRNANEVVYHLPFGKPDLGIKNLLQVRYRKLPTFKDELCLLRHGFQRFLDFARNDKRSGEKTLRREHRFGFTDPRDAMLPAFVATQNLDFHPQKIDRYL